VRGLSLRSRQSVFEIWSPYIFEGRWAGCAFIMRRENVDLFHLLRERESVCVCVFACIIRPRNYYLQKSVIVIVIVVLALILCLLNHHIFSVANKSHHPQPPLQSLNLPSNLNTHPSIPTDQEPANDPATPPKSKRKNSASGQKAQNNLPNHRGSAKTTTASPSSRYDKRSSRTEFLVLKKNRGFG